MIDEFLTTPDDVPPVRPRRVEPAVRLAFPTSQSPVTPRRAIAAGVILAVSVFGAMPLAAAPPSKSGPSAELAR